MSTYTSLYNVSPPRNGGQAASVPASSPSSPPATGLVEVPAPEGETALPTGGFLGPPEYAEGEANAGEPFSPEDVRVNDEEDAAPKEYEFPEPSQGGYELPYVGSLELPYVAPRALVPRPTPLLMANLQASACLLEYPTGSKAYYILECLPCHKAFNSVAGALVHLQATPAHEEVKEVVGLDEAVEICGCRVVNATDEDFVRRRRFLDSEKKHAGETALHSDEHIAGHSWASSWNLD
ncbi:hypothetical protein DL95DRAFT_459770 [Leptodontidium sp. 2 PMI_412]|nr:hypothetical protein DL95DRAFT_459770 [Leptodontidium sp. 2 PMI_412]